MVLCVSAILAPEPAFDEKGEATPTFPGLELTDGWYRIRAVTDATLGRAVSAGRLQIGYKIAITGARLDASRDGTEVLEAITKSRLIISGNSTSIAAWSTRLGFTNKPFISSLPSLTRDGGAVSLMDIRIKKVFPLAYISGKRGEHISPWTAAEEFKMQDQWKVSCCSDEFFFVPPDATALLLTGKILAGKDETDAGAAKSNSASGR